MSRSVPESRSPSPVASSNTFERTGSVVLLGIEAVTACSPSWNCSRVIVNFIPLLGGARKAYLLLRFIYLSSSSRRSGDVDDRSNSLACKALRRNRLLNRCGRLGSHCEQP